MHKSNDCNVVFYDGSGALFHPHSSVIRVRLYGLFARQRETREGTMREIWPKSSPFACHMCGTYFETTPMMIPVSRAPDGTFVLERNFCGIPCAHRWVVTRSDPFSKSQREILFFQLVREIAPKAFSNHRLAMAADFTELDRYGGETEVEEFRAISDDPDLDLHVSSAPIISSTIGVEEHFRGPLQGGKGERETLEAIERRVQLNAKRDFAIQQVIMAEGSKVDKGKKRERLIQAHAQGRKELNFDWLSVPNDEEVKTREKTRPKRRRIHGYFDQFLERQQNEESAQAQEKKPTHEAKELPLGNGPTRKKTRKKQTKEPGKKKA